LRAGEFRLTRFFVGMADADSIDREELARALVGFGCPSEKSFEMAAQLDKRATQLAGQKGCTHAEAMAHLLQLMQRGWAAQERGH
jgi:hypothetical protein